MQGLRSYHPCGRQPCSVACGRAPRRRLDRSRAFCLSLSRWAQALRRRTNGRLRWCLQLQVSQTRRARKNSLTTCRAADTPMSTADGQGDTANVKKADRDLRGE